MAEKQYGRTVPRLWTKPLRELTPETTLGFEVIAFATYVLGVTLYPWQEWLLKHALELRPDGSYRFRRVVVLVARQQGKSMLAAVLAAWWLFIDSTRHPDRVPPLKFKVIGTAQNLDIAREPWSMVKTWCDPEPETDEEAELTIEALREATKRVSDTNGKEAIFARSKAHYEIRAGKNARGKPAARVIMDELREQLDDLTWNSLAHTTKSFYNGMLFGLSNAGTAASVVLRRLRSAALDDMRSFEEYVDSGLMDAEEYANGHDVSLGLFEWSAPDGCAKDDPEAILQANPSIGYGAMTVQSAIADIRTMTDAGYRTEVLCQWVTAQVDSYIDIRDWKLRQHKPSKIKIPKGSRTVWSIDMSEDRRTTWVAAAVYTTKGKVFTTVRTARPGWKWAVAYVKELAEASGQREVAISSKGCGAMELIPDLEAEGLHVHALDGNDFALATGHFNDLVYDKDLVLVAQPDVDLGIEGGVTRKYQDNKAWDRGKSLPVDIAGVIAETQAAYALTRLSAPKPTASPSPPPPAEVLTNTTAFAVDDFNPADASF
ncbi:phage terminase family protein [Leucobacter allii]|uniref:Phage terminase family protein n=1 Tax=Leucobacter allii TaxID=2932247 RepID=A0ABY4FQJ5_9MICO|nr:phage terminase family protein [Leucobacter allii]UOQ58565.1 phage terminase family protein [Leucobacter allii]